MRFVRILDCLADHIPAVCLSDVSSWRRSQVFWAKNELCIVYYFGGVSVSVTTRNFLIHDGLLSSQTRKNASQLTHDDNREKRHVSRVIHLSEQNRLSQIGFSFVMDELITTIAKGNSDEMNRHRLTFEFIMD
jgi:hypothetical protein